MLDSTLTLTNFSMRRASHEISQQRSLDWLAKVHAAAETKLKTLDPGSAVRFEERVAKVIARCACGPDKIATRGHSVSDVGRTDWSQLTLYDVSRNPRGEGTSTRARVYDEVVSGYFDAEYAAEGVAPSDLIHVTCTGYSSPSGAQKLVARKGWGEQTRVTHAYQMGCYAAFPALRIAAGCLHLPAALASNSKGPARVDIVHTELCSLHLDPSDHAIEQLVVQSLFADGFIRYAMCAGEQQQGLRVLAIREALLPDSADAMSWSVSDAGMHMTLARDVPAMISACLRRFVTKLYDQAGMTIAALPSSVVAVHPGGPKIIDGVREVLELSDAQVQTSRDVLLDHGNMSSATLPHIWMRLVGDASVVPGTLILSLAFGPGLTVCGGLFRKK
ncbi:MAG TPA: 3-oxoacyl-[acyl-carrier-protein] synthase III C-terminal domain-containing protein [Polyangiales bacterium]